MAINKTASSFDYLYTTVAPANSSNFTVCGWVRSSSEAVGLFGLDDGSNEWGFGINASIRFFISQDYGVAAAESTDRAYNTWYFVALVRNGTGSTLYVGTESTAVTAAAATATTGATPWPSNGNTRMCFFTRRGDGYGGGFQKAMAYFKTWDTNLSLAEVEAERLTMSPTKTANVYTEYDFVSNAAKLVDSSTNARTLTATASFVAGDVADPSGLSEGSGTPGNATGAGVSVSISAPSGTASPVTATITDRLIDLAGSTLINQSGITGLVYKSVPTAAVAPAKHFNANVVTDSSGNLNMPVSDIGLGLNDAVWLILMKEGSPALGTARKVVPTYT